MTELKTLKEDIQLDRIGKKLREIPKEERTLKILRDLFYYCNGKPMCETDELRAEAVKWIKFEYEEWGLDPYCCKPAIKSWIKHFFNISEEDLK